MSKALEDIAAERQRQVEVEGWTAEHDDQHKDYELARAAHCYAGYASIPDLARREFSETPKTWPFGWAVSWWKPSNRRRDLVKAGALIIAEIERLDRLERSQ